MTYIIQTPVSRAGARLGSVFYCKVGVGRMASSSSRGTKEPQEAAFKPGSWVYDMNERVNKEKRNFAKCLGPHPAKDCPGTSHKQKGGGKGKNKGKKRNQW